MAAISFEYIDLISTASMDLFPDNTPSSFTNQLKVAQKLPEVAYCALEEISYVNTFYTITKDNDSLTIFDMLYEHGPRTEKNKSDHSTYGTFFFAPLRIGIYKTLPDLCSMLNQAITDSGCPQVQGRTIFSYDPVSLKFSYDIENMYLSLFIKGNLINILGIKKKQASDNEYTVIGYPKQGPTYDYTTFPPKPNPNKQTTYDLSSSMAWECSCPSSTRPQPYAWGDWEIDKPQTFKRHFQNPQTQWPSDLEAMKGTFEMVAQLSFRNSIVIYVNIIQSQLTGDSYSEALRIVPIKATTDQSECITTYFNKPYYLRTSKRFISSITVQIRDLANRPVEFLQGVVRLKLRFTEKPISPLEP